MHASVFTAKVVGTVSIGLWAGYNASLVYHPSQEAGFHARFGHPCLGLLRVKSLACSILRCTCASKNANRDEPERDVEAARPPERDSDTPVVSVRRILASSISAIRVAALSGVAFVANVAAYSLAGCSNKHPYLVYLALGAPLVGILQFYGAHELRSQIESNPSTLLHDKDFVDVDEETSDLSASTYEHIASPASPSKSSDKNILEDRPEFSLRLKYSIYSSVVAGLSGFLFAINVIGLAGESAQF